MRIPIDCLFIAFSLLLLLSDVLSAARSVQSENSRIDDVPGVGRILDAAEQLPGGRAFQRLGEWIGFRPLHMQRAHVAEHAREAIAEVDRYRGGLGILHNAVSHGMAILRRVAPAIFA